MEDKSTTQAYIGHFTPSNFGKRKGQTLQKFALLAPPPTRNLLYSAYYMELL